MRYIKFFNEITAKDTNLVGGKNANLGEMYNKLADVGVPVPNGFAVTAEGYDYFIKFNNLEEKIHNVLRGLDTHNIEDLHKRGEEIRNLIKSGEFPEDLKNEILNAFQKLRDANQRELKTNITRTNTNLERTNTNQVGDNSSSVRDGSYGKVRESSFQVSDNSHFTVAVRSSATAEDMPSVVEDEPCFCKINGKIRYLRVKDVYDLHKKGVNDIEVLSLTENLKIKWEKISGMYKHPVNNRKLIKIITKSGREITVTPDHSVLVLDNESFNFYPQRAENIKVGDFVPSIKNAPLILDKEKIIEVEKYIDSDKEIIKENGRIKIKSKKHKIKNNFPAKIIIDDDFAYFIGLYLAEGSIYLDKKGRYTIDISCESEVLADKAAQFLRKYKIKHKIDKNIRINNEILGILLKNTCGTPDFSKKGKGKSAKVKKVPDFIFSQDKEIIASLLRGYFDGDGYIGKIDIRAVSVSKDLINTLSFCLQLLQIKTYLKSYTKKGNKIYSLIIPYDQIRKFNRLVGFTEKKQKVKIFELIKDYEAKNKHQDFIDIIPRSSLIEKEIERENLIKINKFKEVEKYKCNKCFNSLINYGTYSLVNGEKIKRYFCKNCNYWPSDKNVIKERTRIQILDRDDLGRFYIGFTPWNKGLRNKTLNYGRKEFINNLNKNDVVSEKLWDIAYSDIIFDKIVKIEEVNYSGYVYDFIVPPYENFSAGFGGLITHNTASFAGQQETYLNVSEKDLLEKIKFCFASLFTDRAISYREDKGFDHFKVKLSVAVQKMVRSDVGSSGVMFTIDPDNGCPNVIVINSVFGLGELIVQGKVVPDEFMVFKPRMNADTTRMVFKRG
jgi:intein/homing endonuclease